MVCPANRRSPRRRQSARRLPSISGRPFVATQSTRRRASRNRPELELTPRTTQRERIAVGQLDDRRQAKACFIDIAGLARLHQVAASQQTVRVPDRQPPPARPQLVRRLPHDVRQGRVRAGVRNEACDVVRRRDVALIEAGRLDKPRSFESQLGCLPVHLLDEVARTMAGRAREGPCRRVVRCDQGKMQKAVERYPLVAPQVGGRRPPNIGASNHDVVRQVRFLIEQDERRHHLRDAGDRALLQAVRLPENLVRPRVVEHAGRGADAWRGKIRGVEVRRRRGSSASFAASRMSASRAFSAASGGGVDPVPSRPTPRRAIPATNRISADSAERAGPRGGRTRPVGVSGISLGNVRRV